MSQPLIVDSPDVAGREQELLLREVEISRKYLGRLPWEMVVWGLGNFVLWLSIWPLTFSGILPLWAGFLLSTFCITISYLPSHEAQHSIIASRGSKLRWLNELVGHVSTIPLVLPYRLAWITHRQHHAHTNDPVLDPDIGTRGHTWLQSVWHSLKARQPGADSAYSVALEKSDDPNAERAALEAAALTTSYYAILSGLAWSGYAIEAALLWWLPRHLSTIYIQLFLSWAPHHPQNEEGRYRDTRAWRSPIGTMASLGMEYHLIHHLHPRIPLTQTGAAYREMREILLERGIRNDGL